MLLTSATNNTMKTIQDYASEGIEINLYNVSSGRLYIPNVGHSNVEIELTDNDRNEIAQMLGGRHSTRAAVKRGLNYLSHLPSWMKERIYFCKHTNSWRYCAGQDYTAETALIRRKIAG